MELSQLIQIAFELGITPLNLVLLGMLYVFMANSGQLPKFWKQSEDKTTPTLKEVHEIMTHLKTHYNDETTENLVIIGRNQDDMKRDLNKISTKQDKIGDEINSIKKMNEDFEKFGINIRKKA